MTQICEHCGRRWNGKRKLNRERSSGSVQRSVSLLVEEYDMLKDKLNDGNAYGCTLAASGDRILLQLDDCKDGDQVRVSLTGTEAWHIINRLTRLAECLPTEKQANEKGQRCRPL